MQNIAAQKNNTQPPTPSGSQGFLFLIIINQHFLKNVLVDFDVWYNGGLSFQSVCHLSSQK